MPQSKHKCHFHPGHPYTVIWKGGDCYVQIQTSLYPKKETTCLPTFCDSDRLSGRTPALLRQVFQRKTFFMLLLYCYIFYLSLQFLCENSELGHYTVLCKLKAWEWATQPCLRAVCRNPRNLKFGHLRDDRFSFPSTYSWTWNSQPSLDTDEGDTPCEAQLSCCSEMLQGLLGHSSSFPLRVQGAAGCFSYLPIPWAGFGETSRTRSAVRAKETFATLLFLQNKENTIFFSAWGQRQCIKIKSLLCFGFLGNACMGNCLWKASCWTRTSSAMALS